MKKKSKEIKTVTRRTNKKNPRKKLLKEEAKNQRRMPTAMGIGVG